MATNLIIQNRKGKIYDLSSICTDISFTETLNDGTSKLNFTLISTDTDIEVGNYVFFKYDGNNVFYGRVFNIKKSDKQEIEITAYDQLRYLKTKDTIIVSNNDTVTTLLKKGCNYFNLKMSEKLIDTKYKLANKVQDNKTWLDIIYDAIEDTLVSKSKMYALRDNFGKVELIDLDEQKLNLIIGDNSLLTEYSHEISIDSEYYNTIKLIRKNEDTGKRDVFIVKDSKAIADCGLLQLFEVVDSGENDSQVKARANAYLKLYNREYEKISLNAIGDFRVRAGTSFYFNVKDIDYANRVLVDKVVHKFLPIHTMEIEVKT